MQRKKILAFVSMVTMLCVCASCNDNSSSDTSTPTVENSRKFFDQEERNKLKDVVHSGTGVGYPAPSTGDTRVLVVPVEFKDYPADEIGQLYNSETKDSKALKHYDTDGKPAGGDTGRGKENAKEDIRKAFFGESSETYWHSLSSYYKESSYGKLNFNGIVTDWFKVYTNINTMEWVTAKEWADNSSARELAQTILDYYTDTDMKMYKTLTKQDGTAFSSGSDFLQYFDSDGDGYIDVIEMVYSAPYYATYVNDKGNEVAIDNDKFWAYCGGSSTTADTKNPKISKWAFQSYYTCVEGGTFGDNNTWRNWTCKEIVDGVAKVDAHTIVHETGHALGLPDYYDYDYKKNPIGSVDMMAYNIGDHSAYSKCVLGWADPTVIAGPTTVTINSFTKTGDCLIVPYYGYYSDNADNKNANTFMTEYLTIELYNSTGVNTSDSKNAYAGRYPLCPTNTGIKIFHVDSRLGVFDYSSGSAKFVNYTDSIVNVSSSSYVNFAHSNTGSETIKVGNEYQWYIEYLPSNPNATSKIISNDTMFYQGDSFGNSTYSNFTFHNGKAFGYKFTIDALSDDSATITFELA